MTQPELTSKRLADIVTRLTAGRPVRRAMPGWGRLHVDRQLPFLVVYRRPHDRHDPGTERLALGVAGYLLADGDPTRAAVTSELVEAVARVMREAFGAFLIIEVWAAAEDGTPDTDAAAPRPEYRIRHHKDPDVLPTVEELAAALRESRIMRQAPLVEAGEARRIAPPGMRPLLDANRLRALGTDLVGLEVRPVYREESGDVYPVVLRQMSRRLATVFDRAAYRFTHTRTTARPVHFHALGRRAVVKAVWEVDRALAEIGESFDPLLQVTPANAEQAWTDFRASRYQRRPRFVYRPLPFEPGRMKHRLWSIRPERVEDPTLMYLFRETQYSIDRQISMLTEIERPEFLQTSLQVHGGVEDGLIALARHILETMPRRSRSRQVETLNAEEFAAAATAEVLAYREEHPRFGVLPEVRDDIYSGLLVSRGRLLIGAEAHIPTARADALIQHEVGTHLVTRYNGRAQSLRLLAVGLPGYDELQEGLAVLGEYLVGGLDAERMRVLAARVLAVHSMTEGAQFVETWRLLRGHGFSQRSAFTITTRVYRGGGLTKDAMYLRGLVGILDYVADGCAFDRLFLGKFAVKHVPVVDELLLREVLSPPAALPRYLMRPDAIERLDRLAEGGMSVMDLVKGRVRAR